MERSPEVRRALLKVPTMGPWCMGCGADYEEAMAWATLCNLCEWKLFGSIETLVIA
jgi:hypothetical protein